MRVIFHLTPDFAPHLTLTTQLRAYPSPPPLGQFVAFFNDVSDQLAEGLGLGSLMSYNVAKTMATATSAVSWRKTLQDAAQANALRAGAGKTPMDQKRAALGGKTTTGFFACDANPRCDHAVEMHFEAACLNDTNRGKWVEIETWHEDMADDFVDETGKLGDLMSTVVHVEFEADTGKLPTPAKLYLPHAFAETFELDGKEIPGLKRKGKGKDKNKLSKDDMIVVRSNMGENRWTRLEDDQFELVTAAAALGGIPAVCILANNWTNKGAIYAVFSPIGAVTLTRVQCLAFVNHTITALEETSVRAYVVPDLFDQLDRVFYKEVGARIMHSYTLA